MTRAEIVGRARLWAGVLALIPIVLAGLALVAGGPSDWLTATLVAASSSSASSSR